VGALARELERTDRLPTRVRYFVLWLGLFYTAWLTVLVTGQHLEVFREHWGIGVAMAFGSYFAGSTPMGGGTVGFPVLVLLFHEPATMGRDFSMAIQSVGMTSASILIFCTRQPLEWRMLRWALAGVTLGMPLGLAFIAPHIPGLYVKLTFATLWASFGMLHFAKVGEIARMSGLTSMSRRFDATSGLMIGVFAGALVASTTGVGIDMLIYIVLVLMCRADLKIAIPTSVVLMAYTSLIGIATQYALSRAMPANYALSPGLLSNWLVAAPVVALGAPFGVVMCRMIPRKVTLLIVSGLCVVQFVWTLYHERSALNSVVVGGVVAALLGLNLVFMLMYDSGRRMAARRGHLDRPDAQETTG